MNPMSILSFAGKGLSIAKGITGLEQSLYPTLEDEADVVVVGNPQASRYDLYWLAVAAAFGMVVNKDAIKATLPNGLIALEYNAEQNAVRFTCRTISSWKNVQAYLRKFPGSTIELFGGARDELVGGSWQWFVDDLRPAPLGIPKEQDVSDLRFTGADILTQRPQYKNVDGNFYPSENPMPPGDDQSRGWDTIANNDINVNAGFTYRHPEYLLFQALSGPCDAASKLTTPVTPGTPLSPGTVTSPPTTPSVSTSPVTGSLPNTGPSQSVVENENSVDGSPSPQ